MSLDRLLRVVREEAEERREEVLARAREEAEGIVAEARARAEERRARHRAQVEEDALARARVRIAVARREARERVLAARTEALEEIFRETADRFSDAVASDEYREALPGLLTAALARVGGDELRIRCSPGLEEVVEVALAESAHGSTDGKEPAEVDRVAAVEVDPSLSPGFRVTDSDGSLTVDGTLEAALRRLRPGLSVELVGRVEGHGGLPTVPEVGVGPPAPSAGEEADEP